MYINRIPRSVEVTVTGVCIRHKAKKCTILIIVSKRIGLSWKDMMKPSSKMVWFSIRNEKEGGTSGLGSSIANKQKQKPNKNRRNLLEKHFINHRIEKSTSE